MGAAEHSCRRGRGDKHRGKLFLPWDPGVLGIVFEDIHGERNHPFGHQVMLAGSSNSLLDGVEFSTGYGQALFQGGRSIMVLHAFVDHHYHLDAFLNRVIGYYLDGASFFDLSQVYFDKVHHRNYSGTKEHCVSWDPGGKGTASAWGPAEFQGGRIVSDPCSPLPHGWAGPWLYSWALACLGADPTNMGREGIDQVIQEDHGRRLALFFLTYCFSFPSPVSLKSLYPLHPN